MRCFTNLIGSEHIPKQESRKSLETKWGGRGIAAV